MIYPIKVQTTHVETLKKKFQSIPWLTFVIDIGFNSTYNDLRAANCTSCEVSADKSAYWTPLLYYQHSNGSFEEVPNIGMTVYYLGRGENRTNARPFPPGFQMVSGDAGARSYDDKTLTLDNGTYVNGTCDDGVCQGGTFVEGRQPNGRYFIGRPISDRVSHACLDTSPLPETPSLSRTSCINGVRTQIHFQSCWNGVDLYKSDNSHVAYMSQIDNGICPPGYPVQLMHLFYEVLYSVDKINQDGGQFVFAQGDPTGKI